MPWSPKRDCVGCGRRVAGGRPCPHCKARRDASQPGVRERYGAGWDALARRVIAEEPLCRLCEADGRITASTQADHIVPVSVRPDLKQERSNLQGLCDRCHAAKSAAEARTRRRRQTEAALRHGVTWR